MFELYGQRLKKLGALNEKSLFHFNQRGIEKESLRITQAGQLAATPHPRALGRALTHPHITTDYAEVLLELITPPVTKIKDLFAWCHHIHQFVYQNIGTEWLWPVSMPCTLTEDEIRIAEYGTSPLGKMKHIYRQGLEYRYGKKMQCISGVHFNFSFSDIFWHCFASIDKSSIFAKDPGYRNDHYFSLIRNYMRYSWLLPYLFGSSPLAAPGFFQEEVPDYPYATSLRLSKYGYQNDSQSEFVLNYNSLSEYCQLLTRATSTPWPAYEKIGVRKGGEYLQLNTNILQIENEYYGLIRPKRVTREFERPVQALKSRGIEYIELRSLDVDPYDPCGVSQEAVLFLEVFMTFCLLKESLPISQTEHKIIDENFSRVVYQGLDPTLKIKTAHGEQPLAKAATLLFDKLRPLATLMQHSGSQIPYEQALDFQFQKVADPGRTPAAKMLSDAKGSASGFQTFALKKAKEYQQYFDQQAITPATLEYFRQQAEKSMARQNDLENDNIHNFETYWEKYLSE